MNKINELGIKAGLIASEYNGFDRAALSPAELRFADLIITAAINECRQCWYDANNAPYDKDDKRAIGIRMGIKQGALTNIRAIKERFGVE